MAQMIRVHYVRDSFKMNDRETVLFPEGSALRACAPSWWDWEDPYHNVVVDGGTEKNPDRALQFGSEATFVVSPAAVGAVGAIVAQVVISTAVSLAINYVVRALTKPARKQAARDERDSPTYAFTGIETAYAAEGQAIPVVYGRHRTGGVVINVYTRVQSNPPLARIYILLALSEGPINAIGDKTEDGGPFTSDQFGEDALPEGLEINGQKATDFAGVTAHVRLGSLEQAVIPGFEESNQQTNVGQTLRNTEGAMQPDSPFEGTTILPFAYTQSAFLAGGFGDQAVEFSMGTVANEWTAILSFPQGLYDIDSNGKITTANVTVQAAMIEVDDFGTPLPGVNWIVLPPVSIFEAFTSPFQFEFGSQTLEADTYQPPSGRNCWRFKDVSGATPSLTANAPGNTFPSDETPEDSTEWTVCGWIRPRLDATQFTVPPTYWVVNSLNVGTNQPNNGSVPFFKYDSAGQGFELDFYTQVGNTPVGVGGPGKIHNLIPRIRIKHGGGTDTHVIEPGSSLNAAVFTGYANVQQAQDNFEQFPWAHVAFTYSYNNGSPRIAFYVNGDFVNDLELETTDNLPNWPDPDVTPVILGYDGTATFEGLLNDVRIYERALGTGELKQIHNGEFPGFVGTINIPGIVEGWRLAGVLESYSGDNDLLLSGSGITAYDPDPNYATQGGGVQEQKAGKFKVVIQRITPEKEEGGEGNVSQFGADQIDWDAMRLEVYQTQTYPGLALLGLEIEATDQLSGQQPRITVPVEGRKVPVWDGGNPTLPAFSERYSQNPAWCALDLLTNTRYGLGAYYRPEAIDLLALESLAAHAGEYLYKGGETLDLSLATAIATFDSGNVIGQTIRITVTIPKADAPADITRWRGSQVRFINLANSSPGDDVFYDPIIALPATRAWDVDSITEGSTAWGVNLDLVVEEGDPTFVLGDFTDNPPNVTGTLERVALRYGYNAVHDTQRGSAWDQLGFILQVAHATPIFLAGRLSCFVDRRETPKALVNMSNVKEGSFVLVYSSVEDRPNVESVEYLDEDLNWERQTAEAETGDADDPDNVERYRPRRIQVQGITNRAQALRHAKHDIEQFKNSRKAYQWEMGPDGVTFVPGDVIQIAHDVMRGPVSGKLYQDGTAITLYLDRPVTIEFAKSYRVKLFGDQGFVEDVVVDVTQAGAVSDPLDYPYTVDVGEPLYLEPLTPADASVQGLPYAFGETDSVVDNARVVEITRVADDMTHRIRAIEYVDIYDDVESIADVALEATLPGGGGSSTPQEFAFPDAPQLLGVDEVTTIGEGGEVQIQARVRWQPRIGGIDDAAKTANRELPGENREGRVAVWLGRGGELDPVARSGARRWRWESLGEVAASAGYFETGPRLRAGEGYAFLLQAVGRSGARRSFQRSPMTRFRPQGLARPLEAPESASTRVSGERTVITLSGAESRPAASWEARRGGWILGQPMGASVTSVLDAAGFVGTKANGIGMERPCFYVRATYANGQRGPAIEGQESSPPAAGQLTNLVDVNLEDASWAGTLTDLQVEAAPLDADYLPVAQRGSKLKWSGSSLTASYVPQQAIAVEPQWFYVQAHVDGYQVSPVTVADGIQVGEPLAYSMTIEGPIAPQAGSDENVELVIEERHTDERTFSGSEVWAEFRPGRYYFRRMEFRVRLTRTSTDYDVRLRRFSVRVSKIPARRIDHLGIQVFGR